MGSGALQDLGTADSLACTEERGLWPEGVGAVQGQKQGPVLVTGLQAPYVMAVANREGTRGSRSPGSHHVLCLPCHLRAPHKQ